MMILLSIVACIVSLGVGFYGGKLYTEKNFNKAELKEQIEDSNKQMAKLKGDVTANLEVTQKLMNDMKANYDSIVEQMQHTTQLLEKPRDTNAAMPYFSPEAADHLAVLGDNDKKRRIEDTTEQPSDYSDGSSGLFNEQTKPKATESQNA